MSKNAKHTSASVSGCWFFAHASASEQSFQKIPAAATRSSSACARVQIVECVSTTMADGPWICFRLTRCGQNVGHTALGFHAGSPNKNAAS